MITMFLGGLWHGAQWTFALWGLYHGALLVVYYLGRSWWDGFPQVAQRAVTFLLVCLGWIFFRAHSFRDAWAWLSGTLGFQGLMLDHLSHAYVNLSCLVLVGLVIVECAPNASHFKEFGNFSRFQQFALGVMTVFAVLFMNYSSKFLYFQF